MQVVEIKKEIMYHYVCVCLIHDCINSYCEWNSFLKKNLFHSFLTIKKDLIFLSLKIFFFYFFIITTQIWIFISKNHFFLHIPQNRSGILTNQNPFFFYQSKQIWVFLKEETSFINKFVWCNFTVTCSTYHSWHK